MLNEKDALRGLNERFARFIEKVRHLESQNRELEREIEGIRVKAKSSSHLSKQYEPELHALRRQVREKALEKQRIEVVQQHLEAEFNTLRKKCEAEMCGTTAAEENISALKNHIHLAYMPKQDMDKEAKALTEEIEFLKKKHKVEVTKMLAKIEELSVSTRGSSFGRGELTAALRDIRTQLGGRAICSVSHTEKRFSSRLVKFTRAAEADQEVLRANKAQISQYRKQLQDKMVELDSARSMKEALERHLYDLKQRHTAEIHHYRDTIRELENELKTTKYDMSYHMQECQDLLNVKMALDAEIYSYRQLLEDEESRYFSLSDAQISIPCVYRQSPIYTLPSVIRVGEVTRKAEPQYKFVEEIITETTREDIEILDTGFDDGKSTEEGDKMVIKKEFAGSAAVSEVHSDKKETQESATEDHSHPNAERKEGLTEDKDKLH